MRLHSVYLLIGLANLFCHHLKCIIMLLYATTKPVKCILDCIPRSIESNSASDCSRENACDHSWKADIHYWSF